MAFFLRCTALQFSFTKVNLADQPNCSLRNVPSQEMPMSRRLSVSSVKDGVVFVKRLGASGNVLSGFCSCGGNIKLGWMSWSTGLCPFLV